ncbi:acid protease [Leucogyrophana mollusca]|uniref:Acid protease n=1 Tax=Leucogyrophana mollusca TaxID=85980 RepID=A0ACB8BU48_9AGAM|nr:acid protease [Leucogyrophana mollusca]
MLVDTGSSFVCIAGAPYQVTSTSVPTGDEVEVTSYSSGTLIGDGYYDTVTLSADLVVTEQFIVVDTSGGIAGVDGILGLGPEDLTEGAVVGGSEDTTFPTVTDNLYLEGTISQVVVSVSFEPTTSEEVTNGELTFGGTDPTKYTGDIAYTPLTTTYPASYYWGINESIAYGSTTILAETAGVVDTGTSLILIASDAYAQYQSLTGATEDEDTGLLCITTAQYDTLEDLTFTIGSSSYALTPNGQIWPRALNTYIGGTSSNVYLIVNSIGTPSGEGLDFINGYAFLERFYSVFDTTNSQLGFATTEYTESTSN